LHREVTESVSAAVSEKLNPWLGHGAEEESALFTDSARGGVRDPSIPSTNTEATCVLLSSAHVLQS